MASGHGIVNVSWRVGRCFGRQPLPLGCFPVVDGRQARASGWELKLACLPDTRRKPAAGVRESAALELLAAG